MMARDYLATFARLLDYRDAEQPQAMLPRAVTRRRRAAAAVADAAE